MIADDFEIQPRGPYLVNRWVARPLVHTALGDFVVEATMPLADQNPPDEMMLRQVNELAEFVRTSPDAVLSRIFECYELMSGDEEWMEICEVPVGLTKDSVTEYLKGLEICVFRGDAEPKIFIRIQWDPEHGLELCLRNGHVEIDET